MKRDRVTDMAQNGPRPHDAALLYAGEVMHARLRPFGHRFTYKVFSLLVDVDRLSEAGRLSRLFSVNRANLVSFHENDHVEEPHQTLRAFADDLLGRAGLAQPASHILLLAYPRILGYVFNPISVYFAYDETDRLTAVIYSVRNTFGDRHHYVAPVLDGELSAAGLRQQRQKLMHVSPFIGMDARYHFHIMPPGKSVRLRIHETEQGKPLLAATFIGTRRPLSSSVLAANLLKIPFMTWKIMAGIHWEALKLWIKGASFHRSPPAPGKASFHDEAAAPEPGQ